MNKEIKEQWVTALRSGKYRQGIEYLHAGMEFCCLGVLCDLAEQANVLYEAGRDGDSDIYIYDDHDTTLPLSVIDWADLEQDDPRVEWGNKLNTLAGVNDLGTSFAEIADLIEEQL